MDSKPVVLLRYRNAKKLSQKRLEQLVGRWETEGRDSPAVLEIAIKNGRAIVTGFDSTDGERFRVSGVRWDGKSLMFTTYMPSSRHRGGTVSYTCAGVDDSRIDVRRTMGTNSNRRAVDG